MTGPICISPQGGTLSVIVGFINPINDLKNGPNWRYFHPYKWCYFTFIFGETAHLLCIQHFGFAPEKSCFLFCWKASCDWKMCFVRWGDLLPFMFSNHRRWLNQRSSMFTPRKSGGRFKTLLLMLICLDCFDLFCWCGFTIYSCKSLSIMIWENMLGTFSEHVEQI